MAEEKNTEEKTMHKTHRRHAPLWKPLAIIVGVIAVGLTALTSAIVYMGAADNALTRAVERVVPIPAARVGWTHFVSVSDLRRNLEATRSFYENQDFASIGVRVDFSTEDGQKKLQLWEQTLLDKLIEDEVVYVLAKEAGIKITDAQVHARVKQELDRNGKGRIAQQNIFNLWGFTLRDFEERIVKPQLYREALEQYAQTQYDTADLRRRALEAQAAVSSGMDFEEAVRQYSDGAPADETGNAGWFTYFDLLPEIADEAFNLTVGETSGVIETSNGFHIIKIEDRRANTLGDQVLLRHIIVFKPFFSDWLDQQIAQFNIKVYLPDYTWDAEVRHVAITDPELTQYAEQLVEEQTAEVQASLDELEKLRAETEALDEQGVMQ